MAERHLWVTLYISLQILATTTVLINYGFKFATNCQHPRDFHARTCQLPTIFRPANRQLPLTPVGQSGFQQYLDTMSPTPRPKKNADPRSETGVLSGILTMSTCLL